MLSTASFSFSCKKRFRLIAILLTGLFIPVRGVCVSHLEIKEHAVDKRVPLLNYGSQEILNIPFGTGIPEIPRYASLGDEYTFERKVYDGRGDFSLYKFNITDDGDVVLVTGGPEQEGRRIYVFDDTGKLTWTVFHSEPWFNSVDVDDEGRVLLFVSHGYQFTFTQAGLIDRRHGHQEEYVADPPYVAIYDSHGNRSVIDLPEFEKDDFMHYTALRSMRVPFFYDGKLYAGSTPKKTINANPAKKNLVNKPLVLFKLEAKKWVGNPIIVIGRSPEVREASRSDEKRGRVARYRLKLGDDEALGGASLIGGSDRYGYFVLAGIRDIAAMPSGLSEDEVDLSWRYLVLKLSKFGKVEGRIEIAPKHCVIPCYWWADGRARLFQLSARGGLKVIKWSLREKREQLVP